MQDDEGGPRVPVGAILHALHPNDRVDGYVWVDVSQLLLDSVADGANPWSYAEQVVRADLQRDLPESAYVITRLTGARVDEIAKADMGVPPSATAGSMFWPHDRHLCFGVALAPVRHAGGGLVRGMAAPVRRTGIAQQVVRGRRYPSQQPVIATQQAPRTDTPTFPADGSRPGIELRGCPDDGDHAMHAWSPDPLRPGQATTNFFTCLGAGPQRAAVLDVPPGFRLHDPTGLLVPPMQVRTAPVDAIRATTAAEVRARADRQERSRLEDAFRQAVRGGTWGLGVDVATSDDPSAAESLIAGAYRPLRIRERIARAQGQWAGVPREELEEGMILTVTAAMRVVTAEQAARSPAVPALLVDAARQLYVVFSPSHGGIDRIEEREHL